MNKGIKSPDYITELAKDMRHKMTTAEARLWTAINKKQLKGFKFRSQHPVYRYILDFYCSEKSLAIEVDGEVHTKRDEEDRYRDEFLKSLGIKTLRFTNDEIMEDLKSVIKRIINELEV